MISNTLLFKPFIRLQLQSAHTRLSQGPAHLGRMDGFRRLWIRNLVARSFSCGLCPNMTGPVYQSVYLSYPGPGSSNQIAIGDLKLFRCSALQKDPM